MKRGERGLKHSGSGRIDETGLAEVWQKSGSGWQNSTEFIRKGIIVLRLETVSD